MWSTFVFVKRTLNQIIWIPNSVLHLNTLNTSAQNIFSRVRGDCIQCPFHNWKFCGDSGRCVQVPYSHGSIPAQARLVTRPCVETNGLVMVWHHVDGDQPSWYPPAISQVESGQWVYQGRNEFYVNCHIQVCYDLQKKECLILEKNCVYHVYFTCTHMSTCDLMPNNTCGDMYALTPYTPLNYKCIKTQHILWTSIQYQNFQDPCARLWEVFL